MASMRLEEPDLEFAREKRVGVGTRVAYRFVHIAGRALGHGRLLGWLLDLARLTHRLAFEEMGVVYGQRFHGEAKGITVDFLRSLLPPGASVLDVGCGTGRWSREIATFAARVVGVDHDAASVSAALAQSSSFTNIEYVVGDAGTTPGAPFDVALLIHVLEHIEDPTALLSGLRKIADTLVVEVPDFRADPLNLGRLWHGRPFYTDADHEREYTANSLEAQLRSAQWAVSLMKHTGGTIVAVATPDA